MRQKIVIFILLVIVLLSQLAASGLVITYTSDRTLSLRLTSQTVRYQLEIQKAQDGRYLLKAPPFFQTDIPYLLHVGEIQPQGLFSRLLDPMKGKSPTVGFIKGNSVSRNFIPSLEQKLSGFSISGENIELITLSPLLNPSSPSGLGGLVGNSKAYAALLVASQNNLLIQRNLKSFQVNWKELGYGQHMFFSLIGTTASTKLGTIQISSGAFVQGAFDTKLGGGNTSGISLEVKLTNIEITFERRLGGVGVKLKTLEAKANPQTITKLEFQLKGRATIFYTYQSTLYSKPIYGGNSQEMLIEYTVGVETNTLKISSENVTSYEADKGKVSSTTLTAKANFNNKKMELCTQIYRPLDGPCEIHNTSFVMKDEHCDLEIKNQKIKLKLTWNLRLSNAKLELSIDQNRRFTAQFEL